MTGRGGANSNRGNAGSQGGRGPGGPRGGVTNDPARRSSEDDDDNSSSDEDHSYDDEDYYDEEDEDDDEEGEDNANGNGNGAAVLPMQDAFRGFLMNLGSLGDPSAGDPTARGAPMPPMAMLDPSGRMFSFGIGGGGGGDAGNQPPRIARPVKCPVCNKVTPYASATAAGGGSVTDTRVEERCSHHARTMFVSASCPVCMEDSVGPPMVRFFLHFWLLSDCVRKRKGNRWLADDPFFSFLLFCPFSCLP
jgi:hypothetical protein